MSTSWRDDDRLVDLLVKEATEGLSVNENAELARVLQGAPGVEREAMRSMVAAMWTLPASRQVQMPGPLRNRIIAAAANLPQENSVTGRARRPDPFASAGWWAAAAALLLAVVGWWPRIVGHPEVALVESGDPQAARAKMMTEQNVMQVSLAAASDKPLTGDVVFDPVQQIGFLRFRGIPANDPRLEQYQLWIADGDRDSPEPVDGGVFDVPVQSTASGDVIVPFRAKLPVGKPMAFVITMERPGGVVVSKQERVMALARVPSSGT